MGTAASRTRRTDESATTMTELNIIHYGNEDVYTGDE